MQPHHHRINHTPMYFNGLFNNCNFSKHKLMRSDMFQCGCTIIREHMNLCLLKLQLLK